MNKRIKKKRERLTRSEKETHSVNESFLFSVKESFKNEREISTTKYWIHKKMLNLYLN